MVVGGRGVLPVLYLLGVADAVDALALCSVVRGPAVGVMDVGFLIARVGGRMSIIGEGGLLAVSRSALLTIAVAILGPLAVVGMMSVGAIGRWARLANRRSVGGLLRRLLGLGLGLLLVGLHALEVLDGVLSDEAIAKVHLGSAQLIISMGKHAAALIRTFTVLDKVAAHLGLVALRQHLVGIGPSSGGVGLRLALGFLVLVVAVVLVVLGVVVVVVDHGDSWLEVGGWLLF